MNEFEIYKRIENTPITLVVNGVERAGSLSIPFEGVRFGYESHSEYTGTRFTVTDYEVFDSYPQKLVELLKMDSGELLAYKECAPLSESEIYPPTFALTKGKDGLRFWKRYRTNWYCKKPSVAGEEIRLWAAFFNLNPKDLI